MQILTAHVWQLTLFYRVESSVPNEYDVCERTSRCRVDPEQYAIGAGHVTCGTSTGTESDSTCMATDTPYTRAGRHRSKSAPIRTGTAAGLQVAGLQGIMPAAIPLHRCPAAQVPRCTGARRSRPNTGIGARTTRDHAAPTPDSRHLCRVSAVHYWGGAAELNGCPVGVYTDGSHNSD